MLLSGESLTRQAVSVWWEENMWFTSPREIGSIKPSSESKEIIQNEGLIFWKSLEIMFDIFWYPVSLTNRPCPSNSEKSHVESRGTQHLFGQRDERCCIYAVCLPVESQFQVIPQTFFLFPSFFLRVSWTLAALAVSFWNISQAGAQSRRSSGLAEGTQAWNLGGPSGTQCIPWNLGGPSGPSA